MTEQEQKPATQQPAKPELLSQEPLSSKATFYWVVFGIIAVAAMWLLSSLWY